MANENNYQKSVAGHRLHYFFSEDAEGYEVYNELDDSFEAVIPYNAIPLLEHCSDDDILSAIDRYAV